MGGLFPEGLTRKEFALLNRCVDEVGDIPVSDLMENAENYLERIRNEHERNPYVNLSMAEAIFDVFTSVVNQWVGLPQFARPWCRGMFHYFTIENDTEDDFISPIGFEDDACIMNACLRLAGLDALCINPEDYDDV